MICLTRLNGEPFALNPDLIERVEAHPDTVIALNDNVRFLVRESLQEVLLAIRDCRADVLATAYAMDRGTHPRPLLSVADDDGCDPATDPATDSATDRGHAVLHFPHREER